MYCSLQLLNFVCVSLLFVNCIYVSVGFANNYVFLQFLYFYVMWFNCMYVLLHLYVLFLLFLNLSGPLCTFR